MREVEKMNSPYGCYRTRTFSDIFPTQNAFIDGFISTPLGDTISTDELAKIWFILNSKYMNSHSSFSDENQFVMMVYQRVYAYGPTYVKKMEIQDKLRALDDDEILIGTKMIYNHAFNPNSEPSTDTLEEIETINDQNTSKVKKNKLQAYAELHSLLHSDLTTSFINKFKDLFLKIVEPQSPLWYVTEEEDEE